MKNNFEYEITCYKDIDNKLGGILYLPENISIDFDNDIACKDSKKLPLSHSEIFFLKRIIAEYPDSIDRMTLLAEYFTDNSLEEIDDEADDQATKSRIQVMNNMKSKINKTLGFELIQFHGKKYSVALNKTIKKIDQKKQNVYSIKALFPEAYGDNSEKPIEDEVKKPIGNTYEKTSDFSAKYLHSGAKNLAEEPADVMLNELGALSSVFDHISTVDGNTSTDTLKQLYDIITDECLNGTTRDILKIKGPLGSYKNRIMQYLYLAVEKNNKDILPFYLDIAFYERIYKSGVQHSEAEIIEQINTAFDEIKKITDKNSNKIPLLFLDGIRDFSRGNESLYIRINKRISQSDCKLVICLDADFTANVQHSFNVHPLGTNDFKHYMRISSMNLYKKEDSIDFIKNCLTQVKPCLKKEVTAEEIYKNLIRLNFAVTDAYWLIYMLKTASKYILDEKSTIVDLYTAICIDFLGDTSLLDSAAELAYNFEFESTLSDDSDLNYDIRWRLIRKHRSVLDFLIARHYAKKVLSLRLVKENTAANTEQLKIFNMVIQGNISRFAFAILNGNDDYEHRIMTVAKEHYNDLSLIGKSELTFRMTALKNPRRKQDSLRLLKVYKEKEMEFYQSISPESIEEKKDSAFLLRSLFINLIYENDRDAFLGYFNMLLTDKLANSVNRGFHLEYYGDKAFIPNKTLLDFEDNVSKGKKAFNAICLTLNERMNSRKTPVYAAAIEIVSLCNLIQARIEPNPGRKIFNVSPYINNCLQYLTWIVKQPLIAELPDVVMYFNWMNDKLSEFSDKPFSDIRYYPAEPFNSFCTAAKPNSDYIEHMYNCWLVAMLYLPDTNDEYGYDKNIILQMLLLHDLAEVRTDKCFFTEHNRTDKECASAKNTVMQSLLFSGTYPCATGLGTYIDYWNSWHNNTGFNYQVARDIEHIQTVFLFCSNYNQYPDKFKTEDLLLRISELNLLETDLCREIAEKLIFNNPAFRDIINLFTENG